MAVALIPSILVLMNLSYAASAYPFSRLADRMSRQTLLAMGIIFLITADIVLATTDSVWQVMVGVAVWGLHMGATQGVLSAIVADVVPVELRGTAFGIYSLVTGAALLAASVIAGLLWTAVGPGATFATGALFAALAVGAVVLHHSNRVS
jgi:MFS family permease